MSELSKLSFKQWLIVATSKKSFWLTSTALVAVSIVAYAFYGVKVEASVDLTGVANRCPLDAPIMVIVHNHTFRRLPRVDIEMVAWRGGRSENILTSSSFDFDAVTPAFRSSEECFPDGAFSIVKKEAPVPSPVHEETEEERHARIQKMADEVKENERLDKIINNSSSTEYERMDAMDKRFTINNSILQPTSQPIKVVTKEKEESAGEGIDRFMEDLGKLGRMTNGVTMVVTRVDPYFY